MKKIWGALLVGSLAASAICFANPDEVHARLSADYPESLESTVDRVRQMYQAGVPRRKIADWVEEAVDKRLWNTNDPVEFLGFLDGKKLDRIRKERKKRDAKNAEIARLAWDNKVGNCEENANTVYHILKEAGVGGNVRIVVAGFKHAFCVWGMKDGAYINNPKTWGEDTLIVDSWYGGVVKPRYVENGYWFRNDSDAMEIWDATNRYDDNASFWRYSDENKAAARYAEDCFVATAAYGTPLAEEVQILRTYRDMELRYSLAGRRFIEFYEDVGPICAEWLKKNPQHKEHVRKFLIQPIVSALNERAAKAANGKAEQ